MHRTSSTVFVHQLEGLYLFLHPLSTVEDLYIDEFCRLLWENDALENDSWLKLLRPFTAVKNLHLSGQFALGIAAALGELVGRRITEVLPSLQNILLRGFSQSGPFQEGIGQFLAARQLSDRPVAIFVSDKLEFDFLELEFFLA